MLRLKVAWGNLTPMKNNPHQNNTNIIPYLAVYCNAHTAGIFNCKSYFESKICIDNGLDDKRSYYRVLEPDAWMALWCG